MMKFIFVLMTMVGSFAMAHDHTPEVCMQGTKKVCAHLGFEEKFNSSQEAKFKAHVFTEGNVVLQDFKLDLWMNMGNGHGHGSAPVQIAPLAPNMYQISNAWFVMMGEWQVRLNFTVDGEAYQVIIPVQINE